MITRISGKLVEKRSQSVIIEVNGISYEVMVPLSVLSRIDETLDAAGCIHLITYYYFQIGPASGLPYLIGFINEIERDFFLQFITVSGIGPRAAVKALNKPISEIARAIDIADHNYLKTLPGIGAQRAKEVIAKLQGKVARFGLIQDQSSTPEVVLGSNGSLKEEALQVLLQLQYKRQEAVLMIDKALKRRPEIRSTEELLGEIYKQKVER